MVIIFVHFLAGKPGQVSTMSLMEDYLYIGVTSGNLLIVDPTSLTPLITISCHEGPVKHLIAMVSEPYIPAHASLRNTEHPEQSESMMMISNQSSSVTLMTLGNGFNDMISGYPNSPSRFKGHSDAHGWCILLWNASQWEQELSKQAAEGEKEEEELDETDTTEEYDAEEEEEIEVGVNSDCSTSTTTTEEEEETSGSYKSFSTSRSSTDL